MLKSNKESKKVGDRIKNSIELINTGLSLIAIIISIIAIRSSNRSNEEIAQRSCAFDKPILALGVGNFKLPPSLEDTLRIVYGGTIDSNSISLSSLPIQISNLGQKDAEDITFIVQYPKVANIRVNDVSSLQASALSFINIKRSTSEAGNFLLAAYQIEKLNPGFNVTISDPFKLKATRIKQIVTVKDSIPVKVNVDYSILINVSIGGKDMRPVNKVIELSCFSSSSIQDLVAQDIKSLKRPKKGIYTALYILPERRRHATKAGALDEFSVHDNSIYMVKINDTSPNQDLIAALYNHHGSLEKALIFDFENNLKGAAENY